MRREEKRRGRGGEGVGEGTRGEARRHSSHFLLRKRSFEISNILPKPKYVQLPNMKNARLKKNN